MRKFGIILLLILVVLFTSCTYKTDKMDDSLKTQLKELSLERIHVIIEFNEGGRPLNESQSYFISYSGGNTWIVSVAVSKIKEIERLSSVKKMRGITPESKLHPYILEWKFPPYIINPDGSLNLLVACYEDVPSEECKSIVSKYGRKNEIISKHAFSIKIFEGDVIKLAKEDVIESIEEGASKSVSHDESV